MTAPLRVKPGPELDRLVAEKVMGRTHSGKCFPPVLPPGTSTAFYACPIHFPMAYSTDIAAAWEVAERFFGAWRLSLERSFDHLVWNCEIETVTMSRSQIRQKVYARSDVAPLAICLAALRVKGVDVEIDE